MSYQEAGDNSAANLLDQSIVRKDTYPPQPGCPKGGFPAAKVMSNGDRKGEQKSEFCTINI